MVVHFPYIFKKGVFSPQNISSDFVVHPDMTCPEATESLDALALSLNALQSENTNVSAALEFVSAQVDPNKPTAVVTIISGVSDGHNNDPNSSDYPINTIGAAIELVKAKTTQLVRFFAVGDSTNIRRSTSADFESELRALSDYVKGAYARSGSIITLVNQILDLLTNGNVVCLDQG